MGVFFGEVTLETVKGRASCIPPVFLEKRAGFKE